MRASSTVFERAIGRPVANTSFRAMDRSIRRIERYGVGMVHTARPFSFYREVFYGGDRGSRVRASLRDKRVVYIGCGYTPFAPDSMFQACARAGVEFYGVDPLLADPAPPGLAARWVSRVTGGSGRFMSAPRAMQRALSTPAQSLPFKDESVDEFLCSYLLFVWIRDEATLLDIFSEMHRTLKPGGCIKLFPMPEWHRIAPDIGPLARLLETFTVQQSLVRTSLRWGVAPGMLTRLDKIAADVAN